MSIAAAMSVDNIVVIDEILLLRALKWVKSVVRIFLEIIDCLFAYICQKILHKETRGMHENRFKS